MYVLTKAFWVLTEPVFLKGLFDVEVDGTSLGQFDGESEEIENTQLLASAKGLAWGEHTVCILVLLSLHI